MDDKTVLSLVFVFSFCALACGRGKQQAISAPTTTVSKPLTTVNEEKPNSQLNTNLAYEAKDEHIDQSADDCSNTMWKATFVSPKNDEVVSTNSESTLFSIMGTQSDIKDLKSCKAWIILQPLGSTNWWPQTRIETPGKEWRAAGYLHKKLPTIRGSEHILPKYTLGIVVVDSHGSKHMSNNTNNPDGIELPEGFTWAEGPSGENALIYISENHDASSGSSRR